MKNRFISIKLRIVAIAVLFSVTASITMVGFAYDHFRKSARQNYLQSTEFNLSLVSGLIAQDLQEFTQLRDRGGNDDAITEYLADQNATAVQASRAYEHLASLAQQSPAYQHLLRVLLVSQDHERILQTGSGTTTGRPVTRDSILSLEALNLETGVNVWQGVAADPFAAVDPAAILVTSGTVYHSENMRRREVGTSYLMVSLNLIREPVRSYKLPEGSHLYLTIGDKIFSLDTPPRCIEPPASALATDDPVMDSRTLIMDCTGQDGTSLLGVSCPIGDTNLYLTQTIVPETLSMVPYGQMNRQIALMLLLAALMGGLLMGLLHRMISLPLKKLTQRMEVISQGDFARDPSVEWNNEIGEIGKGINDYACNMRDLMERRVSDEKARQELEYEVLLNQVNPHFLYNTLNSIKWMATIQQASGIAEMTSSLARLLKTLSKGQHSLIPLAQELSLLDDYYVIQKYRYGGSIVVNKQIEPDCEKAMLPRFSLQPLLENAIFHGIEPKGGVGTILLTARREGGTVIITLEDDGVGIPQEQIPALLSDNAQRPSGLFRGIGLSNVNSRIRRIFGPAYGLDIESVPGSFTRIILRIPFVTDAEQEDSHAAYSSGR